MNAILYVIGWGGGVGRIRDGYVNPRLSFALSNDLVVST